MSEYATNKEKISFREIVLQHLKKILELSTTEFRGGFYNYISQGNVTQKIYVEDNHKRYYQAIENLSMILVPHFDSEMTKYYTKYLEERENLPKEIKEKMEEEETSNNYGVKLTTSRRELSELLFIELNKLLKRNQYLKTAIYTEEED